ncbi:selenoprotein W-like [Lepidochelys kempii]|uniref:selenoprotein W-like n=1 Tax=Lepidochelys kempii TaxID=8472 RepID=UPI003C701DBC
MGMRSSPNPPQQPPPSSPWGFLRNSPAPCLDCWGSRGAQTGEMAPGSGAFEVLLPDSGEVLHSKINGDGYVDSNAKVQRICEGISKVLKQ